ncbi:DUF317 domain-containing protein [Streptomyces albus]|uniref:DUF317 domain-containing protein n=1 Tax=Streptomyces albus TaxID=1888 RepID=UPI000D19F710|nr:DUF317 domain-containing protein [Streptomyces albus]
MTGTATARPRTTPHTLHESQARRLEFIHDADPRETVWTMAEYTSPVGERLWHATAPATTPPRLQDTLLTSLADSDTPAPDSALTAKAVAVTIRALVDADWTPAVDDRRMRWSAPGNSGGVEFDAHAAQSPTRPIPT